MAKIKIKIMEEQFVPYMIALKLKELGFNEECFGYYDNWLNYGKEKTIFRLGLCKGDIKVVPTPLWQQVFDWFEDKHGLFVSFDKIDNTRAYYFDFSIIDSNDREFNDEDMIDSAKRKLDWNKYDTHRKARQACLEKLIEIYEQTRKNP